MPTVAPLRCPEATGISEARAFGEAHGYIPLAWREQLRAIAQSGGFHFGQVAMVWGFPFGCDYCGRAVGARASCDGCGAPIA